MKVRVVINNNMMIVVINDYTMKVAELVVQGHKYHLVFEVSIIKYTL